MIARSLPKDLALADFMAAIPAYMEGPNGQKEETSKAVTMLLEVCLFFLRRFGFIQAR
jgi:hypothetical protein